MQIPPVRTPRGVKDMLPEAARGKAVIEARLASLFDAWGYDPVQTPIVEFDDVVRRGDGPGLEARLFKLFDREGQTLALRPDITTSVARLVATRFRAVEEPLRFRYTGSVFRYDRPQAGFQREFTQGGVELIGLPGAEGDAEVIALAVAALGEVGLRDVHIDVGHVGFYRGIVEPLGLPEAMAADLRVALLEQNFVTFQRLAREAGLPDDARRRLESLPKLRGGPDVLRDAARIARDGAARAAVDELDETARLLEAHGVAGHVRYDLGMIKDFDYYTGMLLEGYTPELGFSLLSGGRYDGLIGRFGIDRPATGFALGVDRLLLARERQGARDAHQGLDYLLVTEPGRRQEAYGMAWRLRTAGHRVVVRSGAFGHDARKGAPEAVCVVVLDGEAGSPVRVVEATGRDTRLDPNEVGEARPAEVAGSDA